MARRKYSSKFRNKVTTAIDEGMSKGEAAKKFKVTRTTVGNWLGAKGEGDAATEGKRVYRRRVSKALVLVPNAKRLAEENAKLRDIVGKLLVVQILGETIQS